MQWLLRHVFVIEVEEGDQKLAAEDDRQRRQENGAGRGVNVGDAAYVPPITAVNEPEQHHHLAQH